MSETVYRQTITIPRLDTVNKVELSINNRLEVKALADEIRSTDRFAGRKVKQWDVFWGEADDEGICNQATVIIYFM